jgi:polyhydroxybutyrate depolymerase
MTVLKSARVGILLFATASLYQVNSAAAACFDTADACEISGGSYHVAWPPGVSKDAIVPAVVTLHGYKGSGLGLLKSGKMVKTLLARGYAVIAPEGTNGNWSFRGEGRDDVAFIRAIADDAAKRSNIERDRMMLAGFSLGGSMVAYVACRNPEAFKGYAPIAGNFWKPKPDHCAGPVNYLHTHGTKDTTMPVAGRRVGSGLQQANLLESLATLARASGCDDADSKTATTRNWSGCKTKLRLVMHPGGHSIPQFWADTAINWFEGL